MAVMHRTTLRRLAIATGAVLLLPAAARADSTPVGPLPQGPVQTITVKKGQLVALALPKPSSTTGLVWRVARAYDSKVVQQREEADVGNSSIVVVFKASGKGRTSVIFAETRGDGGVRALKALRFRITVS